MFALKEYKVDTGHICTMIGEKGKPLEFLSIGDYGKEKNIKADFLGLTGEINGVPHGSLLPLEEKWVVTISSQYGCSMNCSFCDVPKVGAGINATYHDLLNQVLGAISLHPEVKGTDRFNLHIARMGEPTWNGNVLDLVLCLHRNIRDLWNNSKTIHPVISTMMPKRNKNLYHFLRIWIEDIKNNLYEGEAGLQLSINTTDEERRKETMPESLSLRGISDIMCDILQYCEDGLKGRKIALNFALTGDAIDAKKLWELFSPNYFMCKITPMHNTMAVVDHGMITDGGYDHYYPYKETEEALKAVGFDVIVFVPSKEEDESKITCGNAILATGLNNE